MSKTLQQAMHEAAEGCHALDFCDRGGGIDRQPFKALVRAASGVARGLRDRGVGRGDRVALVQVTSPDLVISTFAALLLRAVPIILPTPAMGRSAEFDRMLAEMLRAAGTRILIGDPSLRGVLELAIGFYRPEFGLVTPAELADPGGSELHEDGRPDEIALIQFSSGTTIAPKPIALTHRNILSNTRSILARFPGPLSEHRGACWLPLYHDMGLIGCLCVALIAPGSLALIRPHDFLARPALWLETIGKTRATVSPAPNFSLDFCTRRVTDDEIAALDLRSWQLALVGAEAVQERTLDAFATRFAPAGFRRQALTPVYGLAEATLAVTFGAVERSATFLSIDPDEIGAHGIVRPRTDGEPIASVGTPLAGVDVAIRDDRGREVGEDTLGHIFVSGDGVMAGYFGQPSAASSAVTAGWLDTGDLGFWHDGELFIYGRSRDLIIVRGRNYHPDAIEAPLKAVAGLRPGRIAAFSVRERERPTEGLWLVAELDPRTDVSPADCAREARAALIRSAGLLPAQVHILEPGSLPRTTSGKIQRLQTRRELQSGALVPLASLVDSREDSR